MNDGHDQVSPNRHADAPSAAGGEAIPRGCEDAVPGAPAALPGSMLDGTRVWLDSMSRWDGFGGVRVTWTAADGAHMMTVGYRKESRIAAIAFWWAYDTPPEQVADLVVEIYDAALRGNQDEFRFPQYVSEETSRDMERAWEAWDRGREAAA